MAGKGKQLTPAQTIALNDVRQAKQAWVKGQSELRLRIKAQLEEEMRLLDTDLILSVRRAYDLEISKRRIGIDGLNTTDAHTVNAMLRRTEHMKRSDTPLGAFSWAGEPGQVRIDFAGFATTSQAEDYPGVLRGVVKLNPQSRSGWSVVTDEGDQRTDLGVIPGHLTWEIEEVAKTPDSLTFMLDEWAVANS